MDVIILGNGGAISNGLPYNSFIIDEKFLVETPPDIMNSIFREGISIEKIESIYISHFHGDHAFGFPFLMLRMFFNQKMGENIKRIKVYSPAGGGKYLNGLVRAALSDVHPCLDWIAANVEFIDLSEHCMFVDIVYELKLHRMDHPVETYGFVLYIGERAVFAYTADTLWCDGVDDIIRSGAGVILIDLNGEPDDPRPVHISEKDILERGFPILKPGARFYGTHLKKNKTSSDEKLIYPMPGSIIAID